MVSVGESDVGDGACPSVKEQPTKCSYRIISGAGAISPFLKYPRKVVRSERDG